MSREVPLLASEKLKLGCLITIVLAILIPAVAGSWKSIYRSIVRDKEGYEKALDEIGDRYYFQMISEKKNVSIMKIAVEPEAWRSYDTDNRTKYCNAVFKAICDAQQKYKMADKDSSPLIHFYVNSREVGSVDDGFTTVSTD